MKPPFDIAGDLDTPVSAFAKLGAFNPRFLLESVEGGERLARYSFIGLGSGLEVKLDATGLMVGNARLPRPASKAELLDALRKALAAAPRPLPEMAGVPLAGGLVGYSSYDVVRYFERLPSNARADNPVPDLHYVAPESMLVFDHLTRGIALLHAGSEAQRQSLRRDVIRALRGGIPNYTIPGAGSIERYSPAVGSLSRDQYIGGVKRTQEYIAAGDVYQLVLSSRFSGRHTLDPFEAYRALRLINPSPYMYYCKLGDVTVVGSSPEALVKVNARGDAQLRPIAGTRPRADDPAADAQHEKDLLADVKENAEHVMLVDLAQRSRPRRARRQRARRSVSRDRALQSRHAHREWREGPARGRAGCVRSVRGNLPRRYPGGCPEGARDGNHRRTRTGPARAVWRHGRLLRRAWRHGPGHHDPHAGVPR